MGEDAKDIMLLVVLVLVVVIGWANGSLEKESKEETAGPNPFVRHIDTSDAPVYIRASSVESVSNPQTKKTVRTSTDPSVLNDPKRSEFAGRVTINKSSSGPRSTDPDKEYVELRVSRLQDETINLMDWRVESTITNTRATIPTVVAVPVLGQPLNKSVVLARPDDRIIIATGHSPVGFSFRTNICTGYLTQFNRFNPSIPRSCPDPEEEILSFSDKSIFIDNECLDLIGRIPRCQIRTEFPRSLSNSCIQAVSEELNYNHCVKEHRNEAEFAEDEWRVFLNRNTALWRAKRETLVLYDSVGKVVDIYSY